MSYTYISLVGENQNLNELNLNDGDISNPSLSFINDNSLGLYRNTNGDLVICQNNADIALFNETRTTISTALALSQQRSHAQTSGNINITQNEFIEILQANVLSGNLECRISSNFAVGQLLLIYNDIIDYNGYGVFIRFPQDDIVDNLTPTAGNYIYYGLRPQQQATDIYSFKKLIRKLLVQKIGNTEWKMINVVYDDEYDLSDRNNIFQLETGNFTLNPRYTKYAVLKPTADVNITMPQEQTSNNKKDENLGIEYTLYYTDDNFYKDGGITDTTSRLRIIRNNVDIDIFDLNTNAYITLTSGSPNYDIPYPLDLSRSKGSKLIIKRISAQVNYFTTRYNNSIIAYSVKIENDSTTYFNGFDEVCRKQYPSGTARVCDLYHNDSLQPWMGSNIFIQPPLSANNFTINMNFTSSPNYIGTKLYFHDWKNIINDLSKSITLTSTSHHKFSPSAGITPFTSSIVVNGNGSAEFNKIYEFLCVGYDILGPNNQWILTGNSPLNLLQQAMQYPAGQALTYSRNNAGVLTDTFKLNDATTTSEFLNYNFSIKPNGTNERFFIDNTRCDIKTDILYIGDGTATAGSAELRFTDSSGSVDTGIRGGAGIIRFVNQGTDTVEISNSGHIRAVDGTMTLPSYSFNSNTGSGISFDTPTGGMIFTVSTAERMLLGFNRSRISNCSLKLQQVQLGTGGNNPAYTIANNVNVISFTDNAWTGNFTITPLAADGNNQGMTWILLDQTARGSFTNSRILRFVSSANNYYNGVNNASWDWNTATRDFRCVQITCFTVSAGVQHFGIIGLG